MKKYSYLGKSDGKKFCIEGIDVFKYVWRSLGECDIVLHPETKKPYSFSLYQIDNGSKTIIFLAGKFSDGNWGFYKEFDEDSLIF